MANYEAEIITAWTGNGAGNNSYRPQIAEDYTLLSWSDSTGQPTVNLRPDPNMYSVVCEVEATVLAAIEVDTNYMILWSEEFIQA